MKYLTNYPDSKLISLYKEGDSNAFEVLIKRHQDKLYTSIKLLVKDTELTEDLFQDLFIKIIDRVKDGRYKESERFLSWAVFMAHNMCIDHFRKVKTSPVIKNKEDLDVLVDLNSPLELGTDENMISKEDACQIREMIDMLPEVQRTVVILRHYAGLPFREIAGLTGVNINTALGRMRYALMNLRKIIAQKQI